jgi:hypothetical protein
MASVWPGTLPQEFLQRGYNETFPNNVVISQTGVGPPLIRRRGTAAPQPIRGILHLTAAQLETLRTFFNTTLKHGSLEFEWEHPTEGSTINFIFVSPPVIQNVGGKYQAAMNLLALV